MTIILVIVILVFLIVVHELGHFIAAKIFGVTVDEFGVGYPPRALLFGTFGGTDYTLNWIPFGGFVRLVGENEDDAVRGRGSFVGAKRWKQAIILIAGVAMNALVAWGLFSAALCVGVPRVVTEPVSGQNVQMVVSDVVPGSPADIAGVETGDQVVALSDASGDEPAALTPDYMVAFVSAHGGDQLTLTYVRHGATSTATVIPANAVVAQNAGRPAIGLGLVLVDDHPLPPIAAIAESFTETGTAFSLVASGLFSILDGALHGALDLSQVVGPVGLVSVVGEAAHNGLGDLLDLAGFIAVNLTIVNLIPIPALDGGRLLIVILEGLAGRRAPKLAISLLNTVGVALIILLMVTVTYHDIAHLFV